MPSWYTMIYSSLLLVTICLFLVNFFVSGTSKIACSIAGYSCVSTAILMILGFSLYNLNKVSDMSHYTNISYFIHLFMVSGPFILLLGIIGYSLYLLITYQNRISDGHTSNEYSTFSSISIILTLIEIYVFYEAMNSKLFMTTGKLPRISYSVMYLIGIINVVCVMIIGTILKYFTTDG
jgi:hypothetical protein